MRSKKDWWKRPWAWCVATARETAKGWRGAVALLRRDLWRPLALIAVFYFLPSFLGILLPQAAAFLSLVQSFVCVPLLFASLARVQLTALREGSVPPVNLIDTVRDSVRQWRELLLLALFGIMLERAGAFVSSTVSQLLLSVLGLFTWIPLLGPLLGGLFSALIMLFGFFVSLLLAQGIYFVWLTRETERTPVLLTLATTWNFLKAHVRQVIGLYACFAPIGGVLLLLPIKYALLWWVIANVLIWLLGTSYAAALYAGRGVRGSDTHSPPPNLHILKRANVSEE
ncbi:MAG: hypothetical protein FWD25_03305 [Clostridia bacterium]|nr:hypothetical protein [Clostridia bacterium]